MKTVNWLYETKRYMQMLDSNFKKIINSKLNEEFNIKNLEMTAKDGHKYKIAYIDPATSENTYQYKDKIKEFGAKWSKNLNTWFWYLNNNPQEVYDKYIRPCLEFLTSVEKTENGERRNVINIINQLLIELDNVPSSVEKDYEPIYSKEELKKRIEQYKQELISIVNDEEFKQKLLPIIRFRKAQGHQYSIRNAILIILQDPNAKMVKSASNWVKMNRSVIPGSPALWLWVPLGTKKVSKQKQDLITQKFLASKGVKSIKELHPGDREILNIALMDSHAIGFDLMPRFYDIRYTQQMSGKEDVVGNNNLDMEWYDGTSDATEVTENLCNAILEVIQKSGIRVQGVNDLGGARGVSKSGSIEYLLNSPKNIGLFNTLVHEFSHELLHQKYLKTTDNNPNGYGSYFIGTKQGRATVEQQAELCAWIVCRDFGFDIPTNINYVGLWGMNEKVAPYVFDTVASAASRIIKSVSEIMYNKNVQEGVNGNSGIITGLDIAKMLGCEKLYLKYKQKLYKY